MKKLKIAFVTSEATPWSKTGGLADVSGTLPHVIAELGHDVILFTPRYSSIDGKRHKLVRVSKVGIQKIKVGTSTYCFELLTIKKPGGPARVYFIDCPRLFDREALYVDPVTGKDYKDNDIRFIFFAGAVLRALETLDFRPDIIHANDWQAALLPVYLKTIEKSNSFFADTRTLLTIHNLGYHGMFRMARADNLGLDRSHFYSMAPLEFWGKINFLKGGIHYADIISTVSETYAREIQTTDDYGCGLEGVLRERRDALFGVINGVDYDVWSPEKDKLIEKNYSVATLRDKYANKRKLLSLSGLSPNRLEKPLIGMISRLADQKGFDLIEKIADKLFALNFTFILLGTGDQEYHELCQNLEEKYPDKIKVNLTFSNKLAHLIEAGADMFLMPSRYEPCGLNQLYSLRYGTVPIAHKTGGLADTIIDLDKDRRHSTGFLFKEYKGAALLKAVKRALKLYRNKRSWNALVKRGMKQDFSWSRSAQAYLDLYQKTLSS